MGIEVKPVAVDDIARWRDLYHREMNCQIVHDNMHARPGWTQPYLFEVDGTAAGYGSILVGGPWTGTRTAFEFFVDPNYRARVFDLFEKLLEASEATAMEVQSNDALLTVMLHLWARNIVTEKVIFEDRLTTTWQFEGARMRRRNEPDQDWIIELDGVVAANGGILYHYNRPYGDIYMEVSEPCRRRGLGCFLVQELKRICYELGSIPCARCSPDNLASRRTLQKAGFVPCAHILSGVL